jgi:glutathione peroxidase
MLLRNWRGAIPWITCRDADAIGTGDATPHVDRPEPSPAVRAAFVMGPFSDDGPRRSAGWPCMHLPRRPLIVFLVGTVLVAIGVTACGSRGEHVPIASSVYGFTLTDITGKPHPLDQYRGKVLMIVNVASECGYTGQYAGLQALHEKYRERGFVILGVPANDFLWQEPGTNEEIAAFCSTRYQLTFPMMAKITVTNEERDPLYWYLTRDSARPGRVGWNFTKFLVGRDGAVVERFGPSMEPDAPPLLAAVEQALQVQP